MIILFHRATNSVAQFIQIILKILASHLQDWAKPFLDNVKVKGPKTKYNNEKVALEIRRYIFEHIHNLDKVLANLKRTKVTITKANSQFCRVGFKIVGYICNTDSCYPNTSKVFKIFDQLECTNVTFARAFIGVCIYSYI